MVLFGKEWLTSLLPEPNYRRQNRWYFGGVSSTLAVLITHPLELLKVILQTQETKGSLITSIRTVYRNKGFFGFYNGVSASLIRQMTSATTRFGLYEILRKDIKPDTFLKKAWLASIAGIIGSIVGVPLDAINVRMQNDMNLPFAERRNYRHVGHGLSNTYKEGGLPSLFVGGMPAVMRGMVLTVCPIVVYEHIKKTLLDTYFFQGEGVALHFTSSLLTSFLATGLTQPLDVWKTRNMCFPHLDSSHVFTLICREGPLAFYKGIVPNFLRLGPHSILLIVLMEQFRLHWGWLPDTEQ